MRPSNSYGSIVARSIWRPLAVVPLDAAIGETLPASLKVPTKLRRQEGGSTALRLMLARFSILVIRVARQVRASRPDAGPRAVSHPLITSSKLTLAEQCYLGIRGTVGPRSCRVGMRRQQFVGQQLDKCRSQSRGPITALSGHGRRRSRSRGRASVT
jgi:hypothetical protein